MFLAVVLVIHCLTFFSKYDSYTAQASTEVEIPCPTQLVSLHQTEEEFESLANSSHPQGPEGASLARRQVPCPHPSSNVEHVHGHRVLEVQALQATTHKQAQQWALSGLRTIVAICSRSVLCHEAAKEFYSLDFRCKFFPMDAAMGYASMATSPGREIIKIHEPQTASISQEGQKGQNAEEAAATADAALLPGAQPTVCLRSWISSLDTSASTTSTSTSASTRRTSPQAKDGRPFRSKVQCPLERCGTSWRKCTTGIAGDCTFSVDAREHSRAANSGTGIRRSWSSTQVPGSSQAGKIPAAQHLAALSWRLRQKMERICPWISKARAGPEYKGTKRQSHPQDRHRLFRKAEGCQSWHRSHGGDGQRRGEHGGRDQRGQARCLQGYPRDHAQHEGHLCVIEDQSRLTHCRGASNQKAAVRSYALYAAFWCARCVGQQDIHLGQAALVGDQWSSYLVQKWSHSVWEDPQAVSEWQADWDAWVLSLEVGSLSDQQSSGHADPPQKEKKEKGNSVSFDSHVQIAIGYEDDAVFSSTWCTHQQLQFWNPKPWGMGPLNGVNSLIRVHADDSHTHDTLGQWAPQFLFQQNRPRPAPHDAPQWMQRLSRMLLDNVDIDHELQPEVVLQTWYLREQELRTNRAPRMIALTDDFSNWKSQLLGLWEDLADFESDAQFHVVLPDPMRTSLQCFHAHLIIVQNQQDEVPILTTVLCHGHRHDFLLQNALFVPRELRYEELQFRLGIGEQCSIRPCTWWKGNTRLDDDYIHRTMSGQGIHIIIHDPAQPQREDPQFPTVEWPYVEPPPPGHDPDDLFFHTDSQNDDLTSFTQLITRTTTTGTDSQPGLPSPSVLHFDNKENCDPIYNKDDDTTFSPTSKSKHQVEDVTRLPTRNALSSLNLGGTYSQQNGKNEANRGNTQKLQPYHFRLLPEIELSPPRVLSQEEQQLQQRTPIWTHPQWIQELWTTLHRYGTTQDEGESPVIHIVTWYISLENHRRCYRPRLLRLDDLYETWEADVRRLWADHIDPQSPTEFFKVFPTPPRMPEQPIAHLLVVQHQQNHKAVLITSLWATQIPHFYGITHVATFLPEQVSAQAIIDASDAAAQCLNRASLGIPCQVSVARAHFENEAPMPCEDGYGIQVSVPWQDPGPLPDPNDSDDMEDVAALLTIAMAPKPNDHHKPCAETTLPHTSTPTPGGWNQTRPLERFTSSTSTTTRSGFNLDPVHDLSLHQVDHDDIDDAISCMATNMARDNFDPHHVPLLEQQDVARNANSTDEDIPQEDLQQLMEEDAEMDNALSNSDHEDTVPASRPQPLRYSSIIYMINSPSVQAQMAYGDRNEFYAQAAAMIQIPIDQLVYLYKIPYPPEDLDQSRTIPMIAQITGEVAPGSIHRYLLIDIEFHATLPSLAPEVERSAKLLPKQLTRFQILRIFGLASYCLHAKDGQAECLVWLNGRLIPEQDRSLQDLAHGDYLRLAVPPDAPTAESFSTREMAAICWVGAEPIAAMGEAGRVHLPPYLPQVPPDTATVYALPPVHYELEDDSLMQLHATRPNHGPEEATEECATPSAPSPAVHIIDIHEMPAFEQRLHSLRRSRRQTRSGPMTDSDIVTTWYLDHHRIPVQPWGRVVSLDNHHHTWRHQILREWQDVVLQDRPALFHIVHPSPRNDMTGSDVHILVTQTPKVEETSILLTVEYHQSAVGLRTRQALAHPRITNVRAIKAVAQCDNLPVGECAQVHHGLTLMNPQLAYDTQDGDHFWIQTLPRRDAPSMAEGPPEVSPTLSFDIEEDVDTNGSLHLLQTNTKRTNGPSCDLYQQQYEALSHMLEELQKRLKQTGSSTTPTKMTEAPTGAHPANHKKTAVVLSLQKQLCATREFQEHDHFHMLFEQPDWLQLFQSPWPDPLGLIPERARLHPTTWEALHDAPASDLPQGTLELYIDGATYGDQAGWAIAAISHDGHHSYLQGVIAGPVQLSPQQVDWIGAASSTNISAEFTALIVAEALALSLPQKVIIRPDLQLSQQLVNGQIMLHQVPTLARTAVSLANMSPNSFEVHEVRAHQGHPWNELADATAKSAAFSQEITGSIPWWHLHELALQTHEAGWNWLQTAPEHLQQAFPLLHQQQVIQFQDPQTFPREIPKHDPSQADLQYGSLSWNLASFNVLSLGDDHVPAISNRVVRLDHQLHKHKILFAGLQETRTVQGTRTADHYAIFASGGDGHSNKQYLGCELWVHRTTPIYKDSRGVQYNFQDFQAVVQIADPRRLMIRFTGPISFTIAVVHGPCLSASNSLHDVETWWKSFGDWINQSQPQHLYVLCDANAPLATTETASFGLHGAEQSNAQGDCFESFLLTSQLAAPCTMGTHDGLQGTWRHPRGCWLRRDYVLLPQALVPTVRRTAVLQDFDLGFQHQDHLPTICTVAMTTPGEQRNKKIRWDQQKFRDPKTVAEFKEDLYNLPMPRWDIDIDTHNDLFNSHIMTIARKHFEQQGPRPRPRPVLSEATLNGIALKRQVLQMMRQAQGPYYEELKAELKLMEKLLRPLVYRDQQRWYDQWLEQIQEAGEHHDFGAVYHKLQRLGRRKKAPNATGPRPLPLIQDKHGHQAQSYQEAQSIWCQQFAELEAGISIEYEQLDKYHRNGPHLDQSAVDLTLLPTIPDLMALARKTKNGKAPGPNGLPAELLKLGGTEIMVHLLPLISKAILYSREPLEWKGGTLIPLYKHKGHPGHASSYRSIFLSDTTGKIYHSWLRKQLLPAWEQNPTAIQHGGRRGYGTDTLHHLVHSYMAWARSNTRSLGLLFLDLRSAFYAVFRASLFNDAQDDRMLILALQSYNVQPTEWHEYRAQLEKDHATGTLSAHAEKLFEDAFHGTHFCMPAIQDPILTTRGTRPGDPIGDIAFNLIFNLIIRQVRDQVQHQLQIPWIGDPAPATNLLDVAEIPPHAYMDMAFVDDAVFAIHTTQAAELVPQMQFMTSVLYDAARLRGLEVNCDKGKTEMLLMHAGSGSRQAKSTLWHDNQACVSVVTDHKCIAIRAVHEYKHLGTWVQDKATLQREIRQRITAAKQTAGRLHRNFFAKKQIGLHTKRILFRSLVLSKHLYNAHVWAWINEPDIARWENGIRDAATVLCRGLLRGVAPYRLHTADVFGLAGLLPPSDQLHANRLKYLHRNLKRSPAILWQLLYHTSGPQGWSSAVLSSYEWLRRHLPGRALPELPALGSLLEFVAIDETFTAKVKSATQSCLSYRMQVAQANVWTLSMASSLQKYHIELPQEPESDAPWTCLQCSKTFQNKRALAMHSSAVHGYRKKVKYWVLSDECLACGKKFFQRHRALMHVQAVETCWNTLTACFPPAAEDDIDALDEQDRSSAAQLKADGWKPTKAFVPPRRLPMPLLPPAGTEDARLLLQKGQARSDNGPRGFENLQAIRAPAAGPTAGANDSMPAFLVQAYGGQQAGDLGIFGNHGLSALCAQVTMKTRIFLHLYSGHRREDDLQAQLERLRLPDGQVHCISLDICRMKDNMDLTSRSAVHFWKCKISDGWICGVGGGPPCETFSAARLEANGPPPLRSGAHPWGLPNLSPKQWKQTSLGTYLVLVTLELLIFAAQHSLCGFMEHPAYPTWQLRKDPPSIWAWQMIRYLVRLQCFSLVTLDQCIYDVPGKKPTSILLLRLPDFVARVRSRGQAGRCPHHGHPPLIGLDAEGNFRTAQAKVYPAGLNSDLAYAIGKFCEQRPLDQHGDLPEFLEASDCTDFVPRHIVQPDYHN